MLNADQVRNEESTPFNIKNIYQAIHRDFCHCDVCAADVVFV